MATALKIKAGMKVRIRSWDSLKKEFGVDDDGDIRTSPYFIYSMKRHCGQVVTVDTVDSDGDFDIEEDPEYSFPNACIEAVEIVKDDCIFEMAKPCARFTVKQVADGKVIVEDGILYVKTDRMSVVEMTVAEIEAKLGIKNLKVVKG